MDEREGLVVRRPLRIGTMRMMHLFLPMQLLPLHQSIGEMLNREGGGVNN